MYSWPMEETILGPGVGASPVVFRIDLTEVGVDD
jgi:hypothetical protein